MSTSVSGSDIAPVKTLLEELEKAIALPEQPQWLQKMRHSGFQHWQSLSAPRRSDEEWRRTDPRHFALGFTLDELLADPNLAAAPITTSVELGPEPGLEVPGVCAKTFAQASRENADDMAQSFFAHNQQEQDYYSAMNAALVSGGSYTRIARNTAVAHPIIFNHVVNEANDSTSNTSDSTNHASDSTSHASDGTDNRKNAIFPHSLVVAEPFSKAVVLEDFSSSAKPLTAVPVIEIEVQEGASLEYVLAYGWGARTASISSLRIHLGRDASLKMLFIGTNGATTKLFVTSELDEPGANSEIYAAVFSDKRTHFDLDTLQIHHVPSCSSNVLCNCAVQDRGRTVFSGNILVEKDAQKTDAYQKNQNLLLSPLARAHANPKLEILADDVRCTHGANFRSYDDEQLFYLQSRGIATPEAKRLLITGFFQDVIERIDNAEAITRITEYIARKLEASLEA